MRRGWRVVRCALPLLLAIVMTGGCAPTSQAVRPERPVVEVHVPLVEPQDVRLEAAKPGLPTAEPPSLADEYRGRWLTVFEVTVTPAEKERPPGTDEGP